MWFCFGELEYYKIRKDLKDADGPRMAHTYITNADGTRRMSWRALPDTWSQQPRRENPGSTEVETVVQSGDENSRGEAGGSGGSNAGAGEGAGSGAGGNGGA